MNNPVYWGKVLGFFAKSNEIVSMRNIKADMSLLPVHPGPEHDAVAVRRCGPHGAEHPPRQGRRPRLWISDHPDSGHIISLVRQRQLRCGPICNIIYELINWRARRNSEVATSWSGRPVVKQVTFRNVPTGRYIYRSWYTMYKKKSLHKCTNPKIRTNR